MTNFSPFKGNSDEHPWMGWERYQTAVEIRGKQDSSFDFEVSDCFELLKRTSQTQCPTVISMLFDVSERMVYWCEKRNWDDIMKQKIW